MTMVKLNQRPFEKTFNSLFEDLFQNLPHAVSNQEWNRSFNSEFVPANIRETADAFLLDLVAPGMEKSDFKINLDKNLLTVSAEKKTEVKNEGERFIKKEFQCKAFHRSFKLDDRIDTAGIQATYEQGILNIVLPKKEEVKLVPKEISIQ